MRSRDFSVLILKAESSDATKHAAICDYLGTDIAPLIPANRTARTRKGAGYAMFRKHIRLTADYVDRILETRYTRHFYSDEERAAFRERHLGL